MALTGCSARSTNAASASRFSAAAAGPPKSLGFRRDLPSDDTTWLDLTCFNGSAVMSNTPPFLWLMILGGVSGAHVTEG